MIRFVMSLIVVLAMLANIPASEARCGCGRRLARAAAVPARVAVRAATSPFRLLRCTVRGFRGSRAQQAGSCGNSGCSAETTPVAQ